MKVLEFNDVGLIYQTLQGETLALKNLSFSMEEGDFVAVVGPSGCGKTTLLSLIAGLMFPTSGEILLEGKRIQGSGGNAGYMLQRDHLFGWRTIEDNILLGLEVQKKLNAQSRAYAHGMLEKYGLGGFKSHYPNQLSGGMRQRAALIRTLAFKPHLLLLDEPFSAIDFQTRMSVCDDIYNIIKSENKTALLVTHDIAEAVSMADKILVLSARPGTLKNIFTLDIDADTPLKRREHPRFSFWFDKVWREVST